MSNTISVAPLRGEIWKVKVKAKDTVGAEMQKDRPMVVVSSNSVGALPLKLVVPLTAWQESFANHKWQVQILPDSVNCLTQHDSADTLQLRAVSLESFVVKIGRLAPTYMKQITAAIAAVIEHE
ncbi:MAG: type II toxin-antitoxin system PemK/MazF family toxin [bacterium]|nr:type II toxin-antitoxin system PemK/MazF family toxin [bacterium]